MNEEMIIHLFMGGIYIVGFYWFTEKRKQK